MCKFSIQLVASVPMCFCRVFACQFILRTRYQELVADSNASLKAQREGVEAEQVAKAQALEARSTHERQLGDEKSLLEVEQQSLQDLHKNCDFLVENFAQTQEARGQDIESIDTALQILNGAKFD